MKDRELWDTQATLYISPVDWVTVLTGSVCLKSCLRLPASDACGMSDSPMQKTRKSPKGQWVAKREHLRGRPFPRVGALDRGLL